MDITIALGLAVVGTVELVKRLFDRDFRASAIIFASAVVGGVGGWYLGIPAVQGVIIGLQGSGLVTTAAYISNKVNVSN